MQRFAKCVDKIKLARLYILAWLLVRMGRNDTGHKTKGTKMKELCKRLIEAKLAEDAAKRSRIEAENALIAAFGETKTEGSTTRTYGSYKVTVTKKVSRSLDFDAYRA